MSFPNDSLERLLDPRSARRARRLERRGRAWLADCVAHFARIRDRLAELLAAEYPGIGHVRPQAGYLAWIDCRALGLDDPATFSLRKARVALSPGPDFGAPGDGFIRLNFATSEEILDEIVNRMARALAARPGAG